jgi:hypothetical protein
MILMAMWLVDGNSMMSDYEVEMSNDEHDPASFHVKFLGPKESMLHTKQYTTNNQQPNHQGIVLLVQRWLSLTCGVDGRDDSDDGRPV